MSVGESIVFRGAAVLIVLLCGCNTPKMWVPPELAEACEEIPITDRSVFGGGFRMGPYEVGDVQRDRSAKLPSGASLPGFSSEQARERYSYAFRGGDPEREGACVAAFDTNLLMRIDTLMCVCKGSERGATVDLQVTRGGQLYAGGHVYSVKEISAEPRKAWHRVEGEMEYSEMAWETGSTTGYRVDRDGPVGGVEVLRPGRAWLAPSLESSEREDLACLFGGLLLYEPARAGRSTIRR
jgi:hypothetical protein